jgi:prepilin-type N-terminal cleavage/methylation domain-containing protein
MRGFGLLEIMMALVLLTIGMLSAARMLYVAASSASLSRSKGTAAIAAQDALESLAVLYRQNPSAPDLTVGRHGPTQTQVVNPVDGAVLNRYSILWDVTQVPDPRPGKILAARRVSITVTPALPGGASNSKPGMNKVLSISTVFGVRTQ